MKFVDDAVDGFLMHELIAIRHAEQRLANQLNRTEAETDRRAIARAMSFLEKRLDSVETVLAELDKCTPITAGIRKVRANHLGPPLLAA